MSNLSYKIILEPIKKYAVFQGRAGRGEYWIFFLLYAFLTIVPIAIAGLLSHEVKVAVSIVQVFVCFGFSIPMLAVSVRRLHDINRSGWWLLIGFVPIIGHITLFVFCCMKGTVGPNQFDIDPNTRDRETVSNNSVDTVSNTKEEMSAVQLSEPKSFWTLYRTCFKLWLSVLSATWLQLLAMCISLLAIICIVEFAFDLLSGWKWKFSFPEKVISLNVMAVCCLLASCYFSLIILHRVYCVLTGQKNLFNTSWQVANNRFWRLALFSGPLMLCLELELVLDDTIREINHFLPHAGDIIIGFLWTVTVWFILRLVLYPVCIIIENCDLISGLKRSYQLTQNAMGRILALYFLILFPIGLISWQIRYWNSIFIFFQITMFCIIPVVLFFDIKARHENSSPKQL